MKKTITNMVIFYMVYWIFILLFTTLKQQPVTLKHLEMSVTVILLPLYLTGITKLFEKLDKYLKHLR